MDCVEFEGHMVFQLTDESTIEETSEQKLFHQEAIALNYSWCSSGVSGSLPPCGKT